MNELTAIAIAENQAGRPLAPPLEKRRLQIYLVQLLIDGFMLLTGYAAVSFLYLGEPFNDDVWGTAQLTLPLFWTVALLNRTYSIEALVRPAYGRERAILALLGAIIALLVVLFLTRSSLFVSRFGFTAGSVAAGLLIVWARANMQGQIRRLIGPRAINLMVIDDGGPAVHIRGAFKVDAAAFDLRPALDDPHQLDRLAQVMRNMDRVLVSCPAERRALWAMVLKGGHMRGEIVDPEVEVLGIVGTAQTEGVGSLVVAVGPLGLRARALKRALDLVLTIPALLVLAIPLLLIALLIRLEDGGPALFLQRRVGRANQFFPIYKFRTMRIAQCDADGERSTSREDDRITRIGRLLRKTSIDELPQLLNVLKGDMSLVGPRPHALASQAGDKLFWEVDDRYWQRHALKPGMSGLAQVRGLRGATETEGELSARLRADLDYVRGWTIWRDLQILMSTIQVVLQDRAF